MTENKTMAGQLIDIIRQLSNEYPEALYDKGSSSMCAYERGVVHNGPPQPGCIVGQAAQRTGFFDYFNGKNASVESIIFDSDFTYEDWEVQWLEEVQEDQDSGMTWGSAVERADWRKEDRDSRSAMAE